MSFKVKNLKNVIYDEKTRNLSLKSQNYPLILLHPADLSQLFSLLANNSEEIIIWLGKTFGKSLAKSIFEENIPTKKISKNFQKCLDYTKNLGLGKCEIMAYKNNSLQIRVKSPISSNVKENLMVVNFCHYYNGIFIGIMQALDIKPERKDDDYLINEKFEILFNYDLEGEK